MPVLNRRLLVIVMLLGTLPAGAAPSKSDLEQARVLFERGRALVKDNDFEHACPLFEESQRLVPALGTELNLAQCWAEVGKLLAAKELYTSVLARATEARQQARVDLANDGLTALARRIPHLDIAVAGGTAKVTVDDKPVELGKPIDVDPGSHHVVATGDKKTAESTVEAKSDGATVKVELDVSPVTDRVIEPPPPTLPAPTPARGSLRSKAIKMLAIGGSVAIVGSFGLGAVARHKAQAEDDCVVEGDIATCPRAAARRLRSATRWGNAATVAFTAGAALATTAVVLYLTRTRTTEHPPAATVGAAVTRDSGALVLEGRW